MATKEKNPVITRYETTPEGTPFAVIGEDEGVIIPAPTGTGAVTFDAHISLDFMSDQDTTLRQYEMNEFNDTAKSSLLRMNEKGDIESMVKPILEGQDPVMQKHDDLGAEMNPTIGMIMEHFIDLGTKVATDPTLAGQAKRTFSIPGQAVEGAVRNSLKFFAENVLPEDVQNKFYNMGKDMEELGLVEKEGQPLGGLPGILGSPQEFRERAFFSPEENAWWEDLGASFGQFAVGLKSIQMVANTKKLLVPSMAADGLVFDPEDGSLFSLFQGLNLEPGAMQDVVDFMDSTQHDPNMGRAIQVAEGLLMGGILTAGGFGYKNRKNIKPFIKKIFTPESIGRKMADPAVKKIAELITEVKSKWPKNTSFQQAWARHTGNEAGSVPGPRSGADITATKAFKKWFKGSKVVDENGEPLIVYHGTPEDIRTPFKTPTYFTDNPKFADMFAYKEETTANIIPVYLNIKNPYVMDGMTDGRHFEWDAEDIAEFKADGYDGVINEHPDGNIYVAFEPTQIKSKFESKPKKKTKVKKLSRTEETGTLNTIYPEVNQAMEETMSRMDPAEAKMLRENMEKHAGTPWAAATVRGLTIREFFNRTMEGRMKEALELANSGLWGKDALTNYAMGKAFAHSKEAVLEFAQSYSFIGKNRKAELDISGSFKNCNPSGDCAKFCYASIANARPAELMKAEFTEWVAENHPDLLAKRVGNLYSDTFSGMAGLALRINDKGDLSEAQVELIKALNKKGHRIQIFSKRPDLLAKVPDFNLKMLSIDSSNFELTRKHPEFQLAVTITDDMTPAMIAEVNDRVAVYLPVNMKGGEVTRADVKERFPETFKKMTKKLCPVDGGKMKTKPGTSFVSIKNRTAEKGLWTCTACDWNGANGCFFGKNQTENVKKITNQNKQANSPIK